MADYRAVAAVCDAVMSLLRSNYDPADFDQELEFQVYTGRDFAQPMEAGVSLFLFRIFRDVTQRNPAGRLGPNGERHHARLPLELHFLLTAWGREASLQHTIAGWMTRTLEDAPVLPAGLLNARMAGVFDPAENVELLMSELPTEDLLHIWEVFGQNNYELSVPYMARSVRIASTRAVLPGDPVQERIFDYRSILPEGAR